MVQAPISRAVGTAYEEHGLQGLIRIYSVNGIWTIPLRLAGILRTYGTRDMRAFFISTDIAYLRHVIIPNNPLNPQ
jgi:hypothetical protein